MQGDEGRPRERLKMESQMGISQWRRDVGHACGRMGSSGGRLDTKISAGPASEGRRDCCPDEDDGTTGGALGEKNQEIPSDELRDLDPMVLEPPTNIEGRG